MYILIERSELMNLSRLVENYIQVKHLTYQCLSRYDKKLII